MDNASEPRLPVWFALMVIISLINLWLIASHTPTIISASSHDDAYYINAATKLLQQSWLGSYDSLTLIKKPFYSYFLLGSFLTGLPILLSSQLLYILSCWISVYALKPLIKNKWIFVLIFIGLAFVPTTSLILRVYRTGIYHSLALGTIASAIGLFVRLKQNWRQNLFWSLSLAFFFTGFYLLREESSWMIVVIVFLILMSFVQLLLDVRQDGGNLKIDQLANISILWGIPLSICISIVILIASINYKNYGIFGTNELTNHTFTEFVTTIHSVVEDEWLPYISTSNETLQTLYSISPSFAELEPYLDGQIGLDWSANGTNNFHINNGWLLWALREAVSAAGYYNLGGFPAEYYHRVTTEIEEACQDNHLTCRKGITSAYGFSFPPDFIQNMVNTFGATIYYTMTFSEMGNDQYASVVRFPEYTDFVDITLSRGYDPSSPDYDNFRRENKIRDMKHGILLHIVSIYQSVSPWLFGLGFIAYLWMTAKVVRSRKISVEWVITSAIIGGLFTHILIITLSSISILPTLNPLYNAPSYPLIWFFLSSTLVFAGQDIISTWLLSTEENDGLSPHRLSRFIALNGSSSYIFLALCCVFGVLAMAVVQVTKTTDNIMSIPHTHYEDLSRKLHENARQQFSREYAGLVCPTIESDTLCGIRQQSSRTYLKNSVVLPDGVSELHFAIAVTSETERDTQIPDEGTFKVAICTGNLEDCTSDSDFELIYSESAVADVGWLHQEIMLDNWANQTVTLGLRIDSDAVEDKSSLAIWGRPHLITRVK